MSGRVSDDAMAGRRQLRSLMHVFVIGVMVLAIECTVEAPPPPFPLAAQAEAVARQDATPIQPNITDRSFADASSMGDMLLPRAGTEADVYALLFEVRYHGTAEAAKVVTDEAVPMPTLTGSAANWLKEFADLPVALWASGASSVSYESAAIRRHAFPQRDDVGF